MNYVSLYMSVPNNSSLDSKGDLYEEIKETNFLTLKDLINKNNYSSFSRQTLKKELVKSYEELSIANFYFLNSIEYEYEKPYGYGVSTTEKRQYTPDFYFSEYKIYHEHYGIDHNNQTRYTNEENDKYIQSMDSRIK